MLGLFQTASNFLNCSKAVYGGGWAEKSAAFPEQNVIFTSLKFVHAFSDGLSFFGVKVNNSMAPQILNFSAHPQWRCPTSVAPDAKSCLSLRMFWLL